MESRATKDEIREKLKRDIAEFEKSKKINKLKTGDIAIKVHTAKEINDRNWRASRIDYKRR
jgi:predicted house-cleaning noncanonical NTP pyrophosphatase (MazG superfamily)